MRYKWKNHPLFMLTMEEASINLLLTAHTGPLEEMTLTFYQKALHKRAPEMNALHMETLAYAVGSTLNGMPPAFFDDIAAMAQRIGAEKLAAFHQRQTVAA